MKTACIATAAIIGCASAAPQRMRVRSLQGSMSMPEPVLISAEPELISAEPVDADMSVAPTTIPAVTTEAAVATSVSVVTSEAAVEETPVTLPEEISMPSVEESMSAPVPVTLPEDVEVVVEEVLWESLSIPAIYEEIYGASMSMPEDWTPEDAGFVPSETGSGYVEPSDEEEAESDDVTSDDTPSSAAIVSGAVSAACVVAAMALF